MTSSPLAETRAVRRASVRGVQRQQPGHLTVLRHEGTDQASEPDRIGDQVVTDGIGAGAGRQVALIEDEEEDGEYAGDAVPGGLQSKAPVYFPPVTITPRRLPGDVPTAVVDR